MRASVCASRGKRDAASLAIFAIALKQFGKCSKNDAARPRHCLPVRPYLVPRDDKRPNILGSALTIDRCAEASLVPARPATAVLKDRRSVAAGVALANTTDDAFAVAAAAITTGAGLSR